MKTVLTRSVVRPAGDGKHRNRRVRFKDDIEEELDKNDGLQQDNGLNDRSNIDQNSNEGGIASRTRSKVKDESEGPIHDETPVSERTRSRVSGTFHVGQEEKTPGQQNQRSWMKILPTIILFATFQLVNYMGNSSSMHQLLQISWIK
jgi:hypothetical protein